MAENDYSTYTKKTENVLQMRKPIVLNEIYDISRAIHTKTEIVAWCF